MSAYARSSYEVVPPMVGPFTFGWSNYAHEVIVSSGTSSGGWESANRAAYMPILVPTVAVARRLWWANGASVSATYNFDCGIYADAGYKPGARIVSAGSTAQGNASEVQFVDITDTVLTPGLYWIALVASTISATVHRLAVGLTAIDAVYKFQQASALALPATATPAEAAVGTLYACGFATTASP